MRENLAESQDTFRERNKRATDKLLSRLQRHHLEIVPKTIPIVEVVTHPEPVRICVLPILEYAPVSVDAIKRVICRQFDLSHAQIISENRQQDVAYPRQIAMYLCRERTPFSLARIGKHFGDRDHTTVFHAITKITTLIKDNWRVAHDVAEIEAQL